MIDFLSNYFSPSIILILVTLLFQLFSLIEKDKLINETKKKWANIFFLAAIAIATAVEKSSDGRKIEDLKKINDSIFLFASKTNTLVTITDSTTRDILGYSKKTDSVNAHLKNTVDSLTLLQKGTILLSPCEQLIKVDTLSDSLKLTLFMGNLGNTVANDVSIDIWAVNKKNKYDYFQINRYGNLFFDPPQNNVEKCYEMNAQFSKYLDVRDYAIVYKISYTLDNSTQNHTRALMFRWDDGIWKMSTVKFSYIPYPL